MLMKSRGGVVLGVPVAAMLVLHFSLCLSLSVYIYIFSRFPQCTDFSYLCGEISLRDICSFRVSATTSAQLPAPCWFFFSRKDQLSKDKGKRTRWIRASFHRGFLSDCRATEVLSWCAIVYICLSIYQHGPPLFLKAAASTASSLPRLCTPLPLLFLSLLWWMRQLVGDCTAAVLTPFQRSLSHRSICRYSSRPI